MSASLRSFYLIILTGMSLGRHPSPADAGPFGHTFVELANKTKQEITIIGLPNENFRISYTDATGAAKSVTVTTVAMGLTARARTTIQAKNGTTVSIDNLSQPAEGTQTFMASLFQPPENVVVSRYSVEPASSFTLGGMTFALTGGFTTLDTTVDYDPLSPTYGIETGSVSALNLTASGPDGFVSFDLTDTPAYSQDLSSIWAVDDFPDTGLSIPQIMSFSGLLTFNAITSPFTGMFDGMLTFFNDGSQTILGDLTLSTDFGSGSGSLSATAQPALVPEPHTVALLGAAALGLMSYGRRRRKAPDAR